MSIFKLASTLILGIVLAVWTSSCSDEGGRPTGPSGTLTQQFATTFSTSYGDEITTSANGFNQNGVQGKYIAGASVTRGMLDDVGDRFTVNNCQPTISPAAADQVDADSDDIPVTVTTTYNCSGTPSNIEGYTANVTGNFSIQDQNDSVAISTGKSGWSMAISNFSAEIVSAALTFGIATNGTYNFLVNGASFTSTNETSMTLSATTNLGRSQSISVTVNYWIDITATATSADAPANGGTMDMSGYTSYSDGTNEYTLQMTSTNLVYGCISRDGDRTNFLESGSINFVDGDGNILKAEYTSCSATWKYNDTAL